MNKTVLEKFLNEVILEIESINNSEIKGSSVMLWSKRLRLLMYIKTSLQKLLELYK